MGLAKKKLLNNSMTERVASSDILKTNILGSSSPSFEHRHIGPNENEQREIVSVLGEKSLDGFINKVLPTQIQSDSKLNLKKALSEPKVLRKLQSYAEKNKVEKSYIGMGYYAAHTPPVILRNILENPAWYTQYTPYQAEISQGRLEALLNFQTMVSSLSGMEFANSSLLDEATALAEAMQMCFKASKSNSKKCLVSNKLHPQSISVLKTRAEPIGVQIVLSEISEKSFLDDSDDYFSVIVQYPNTDGIIDDYSFIKSKFKDSKEAPNLIVASDLLALTLLTPPGEWGADVVVGSSQRFGIPLWYGGPHAGFFATSSHFKRFIPGRVVGVSKDKFGNKALRLALQVREQHIKRDRATSNICTSQVLLAVAAGMYGVYHGSEGLSAIAQDVTKKAKLFKASLLDAGFDVANGEIFDTVKILLAESDFTSLQKRAEEKSIQLRTTFPGEKFPGEKFAVSVSFDETHEAEDLLNLYNLFCPDKSLANEDELFVLLSKLNNSASLKVSSSFERQSSFLENDVFSSYQTETELLRYINRLSSKDLSLVQSMIPLGSCTMKLNATTELAPISFPEFCKLHPFAPQSSAEGYLELINDLEQYLADITGFSRVSFQPNAGSQGEYAGLLSIRAWHISQGNTDKDICLIPTSAHGTNPASAVMAGMKVLQVKCDELGNIDLKDLKEKITEAGDKLSSLMITYPSTHGVFEESIKEVCDLIHKAGGQVYMDGANMNAQVGLLKPGELGADVCHLNLHKTFCIPHGGGGPGVGPICVAEHLSPFLPSDPLDSIDITGKDASGKVRVGAVSAANYGSAGILPISLAYILLMGGEGLKKATEIAILNANYLAKELDSYFPVLFKGPNGLVAHECILDFREVKKETGVTVEDIAKRLMDYGFHAPTVSWPVPDTLMIEPTESESKYELDRFLEAMIGIYQEIEEIKQGGDDLKKNNILKNAPHTALEIGSNEWTHSYSREKAAWPVSGLRDYKFWPAVARIDSAYGDRNFCPVCE